MGKMCFIIFLLQLVLSCSLISPKNLLIENDSKYTIKVIVESGEKEHLVIKKNSGDFILTYEDKVKLQIKIDEIGYTQEIIVKVNYLETKKITFNLETF
ncbi:MAG TPA: hypothetical protein PK771_10140 [Spirochaetota bacterium]|nr:hypothetical protein [Spirochaetota bacterium]